MTSLPLLELSPEGVRVMREALAEARDDPEHELDGALRMHEKVRYCWHGCRAALARGVEGYHLRGLLGVQIAFCGADAVFLHLALEMADAADPEEVRRAQAALAEAG